MPREFIYSRNAVYETLLAGRRQLFRLQVAEGVQARGRLDQILQIAQSLKVPVLRTPRAALDRVHPGHQGVILEASSYPYQNLQDIFELAEQRGEPLFVLLLDSLNDPQNFGTLLRTAEAVGVHGVILPLARTVGVTPSVVNTSSGASEHLLISQANLHHALIDIKKAGAWIIGLDQHGDALNFQHKDYLKGALGLVVGSEAEGVRPLVKKSCDFLLGFPMVGKIESLNAAVAGSLALFLAYMYRCDMNEIKKNENQ